MYVDDAARIPAMLIAALRRQLFVLIEIPDRAVVDCSIYPVWTTLSLAFDHSEIVADTELNRWPKYWTSVGRGRTTRVTLGYAIRVTNIVPM